MYGSPREINFDPAGWCFSDGATIAFSIGLVPIGNAITGGGRDKK